MMGRNHLITGTCALEHAYVASVLIDRADSAPLTAIQKITQDYLGLTDLVQGQEPLYIAILSMPLCLMMYFIGILLPDIDFYLPMEHRTWLHAIYISYHRSAWLVHSSCIFMAVLWRIRPFILGQFFSYGCLLVL